MNCAITSFVDGETTVLVNTTIGAEPKPAIPAATALSTSSKVASLPSMVGKRKRAVSYKSRTEA